MKTEIELKETENSSKAGKRNLRIMESSLLKQAGAVLILAVILMTGCGQDQNIVDTSAPEVDTDSLSTNIMERQWERVAHFGLIEAERVSGQVSATNDSGSTIVAWVQKNPGTRADVKAVILDNETKTWSDPELIESNDTGDAISVQAAMNPQGSAIVTWFQFDGRKFSIYANRYDSRNRLWETETEIDFAEGGHAMRPLLVMDDTGNAVVIWYQHDGMRYSIFSSRYDSASGAWGEAELVEFSDTGDAYHPAIASTSDGRVMAVWKQYDGERFSIWANSYDYAGGWGEPALLEDDNRGDAYDPDIAINEAGDAVAIWHQNDGTLCDIYANRFDALVKSWGEAELLDSGDHGIAYQPKVDIDKKGNAIAVWIEYDNERFAIYANRFDAEAGVWQGEVNLDAGNTSDSDIPEVAMDSQGNAVVVWQNLGESCKIQGARYDAATDTWGEMEHLCATAMNDGMPAVCGDAFNPKIRFDGNDRAILTWRVIVDEISGVCVLVLNQK